MCVRVCVWKNTEKPKEQPEQWRMLDFGQFDFGQFDFGQLAEIGIGRSRHWPKSKLAEVEINWPKSNR